MSIFDVLGTEAITLEKADGRVVPNIKATVQPELVIVDQVDVDFEEGDAIVRMLPNGKAERHLILEANLFPGLQGDFAHYQLKVRKETRWTPAPTSAPVTYNVHGPNARVNVNSHDSSTNIASTQNLFAAMRERTAAAVADAAVREEMTERIDRLEHAQQGVDRVLAYNAFMASAADHMAIYSPFLVPLAQYIAS